jgi:hypothetical protein
MRLNALPSRDAAFEAAQIEGDNDSPMERSVPFMGSAPCRIRATLVALVLAMTPGVGRAADTTVVFRNDLTPGERLIVRLLPDMRSDRAELEMAFRYGEVWIAEAALRVSGPRQKIVVIQTGYFCGSAGCRTLILERVGQRWVEVAGISFEIDAPAPLRILPQSDEGWYRLGWGRITYTWRRCGYWSDDEPEDDGFDVESWCK